MRLTPENLNCDIRTVEVNEQQQQLLLLGVKELCVGRPPLQNSEAKLSIG
jgi:hypothetical protein